MVIAVNIVSIGKLLTGSPTCCQVEWMARKQEK